MGVHAQLFRPIEKSLKRCPYIYLYVLILTYFAFSHQDWKEEYETLKKLLTNLIIDPDSVWYHIGYNSPMTPADQRQNEIWIPVV